VQNEAELAYAFLLGEHISHSLSPAIHNPAYAALGLNYEFGLLDVPPEKLPDALARMRQAGLPGLQRHHALQAGRARRGRTSARRRSAAARRPAS